MAPTMRRWSALSRPTTFRVPFLVLLLAVPLSGCTATPDAPEPDRLMVRVFVEDMDADGRDEAVVRLAAYAPPSTLEPFAGTVEVTLCTLDRATIPRYHHSVIRVLDFRMDDELPYYEVRLSADHLRAGERIEVRALAELGDGVRVRGAYQALA